MLLRQKRLLLLVAAVIVLCEWRLLYTVNANCSAGLLRPEIKVVDGQANVTCKPQFEFSNFVLCNGNTQSNGIIMSENEGDGYRCCCDTCSHSLGNSACKEFVALAAPSRNNSVPSSIQAEWGKPLTIWCPYKPGVYVDGYNIEWSLEIPFSKGNEIVQDVQTKSYVQFNKEDNTIRIDSFNPLFEGGYLCTLSSAMDNAVPNNNHVDNSSTIIVVTEPIDIPAAIETGPSNISVHYNNSAIFNCAASVSNQTIKFSVGDDKIVARDSNSDCKADSDRTVLQCTRNTTTLTCSYEQANTLSCNLSLSGVTESKTVECNVIDDNNNPVSSSTANLHVIPKSWEVLHNYNNGSSFVIEFEFPSVVTTNNVTVILSNSNNSLLVTSDTVEVDSTKLIATFRLTSNLIGDYSYRVVFDGVSTDSQTISLNIILPSTTSSTPSPSVSSVTSTDTPVISSTITTLIATSTLSPVVHTPTGSMSPVAADTVTLVASSVGVAFIVLIIIIIVLVLFLVFLTRVKKAPVNVSGDVGYNSERGELISVQHNGNGMSRPMSLLNTPERHYENTSQISTIDTYIEDPSPRHLPSNSSRSSHSHSSNSCPSTRNLKAKPLPRYGIPDHYSAHSHQPNQLMFTSLPAPGITLTTPTPTMEDHPVLGVGDDYIDDTFCPSPTTTEPFPSLNSPMDDPASKDSHNRPSDLPIGPLRNIGGSGNDSGGSTPLSDQTMLGVLLYLQHKDCEKRTNCQTCRLIDRHFERIANKYGNDALSGILHTPITDNTVKQLRKRERKTQRLRSPHKPQAPMLAPMLKRQRSHSTSYVDNETSTDEDSLNPIKVRIKPMQHRKAVTDDEYEIDTQYKYPLQRIAEGMSLSQHNLPAQSFGFNPAHTTTKDIESDSSSSSSAITNSRPNSSPRFDGSKSSGLSASYMKSPDIEESIPLDIISKQPSIETNSLKKMISTISNSTSSGYDTDIVPTPSRTISSGSSGQDSGSERYRHVNPLPYQRSATLGNGGRVYNFDDTTQALPNYQRSSTLGNGNGARMHTIDDTSSVESVGYSDYLKAASRRNSATGSRKNSATLSPSISAMSTHSSPHRFTSSRGSNQSNHSVHSESAIQYPRTQKHQFYSPPQQRKNVKGRTPSPIQLTLPSDDSSATPI